MLFVYHIAHQGGEEQTGFAVTKNSIEALELAQKRFPGWAVGSTVGCWAVKPKKEIKKEIYKPADLSWIHPSFKDL